MEFLDFQANQGEFGKVLKSKSKMIKTKARKIVVFPYKMNLGKNPEVDKNI